MCLEMDKNNSVTTSVYMALNRYSKSTYITALIQIPHYAKPHYARTYLYFSALEIVNLALISDRNSLIRYSTF